MPEERKLFKGSQERLLTSIDKRILTCDIVMIA